MARPVAGASVEGKDKTAPLSVDGVNRAVYINHTVYEDNPMTANHRNDYGVKSAIDLYRTFGDARYVQRESEPSAEYVAALRAAGVRCRRVKAELFIHHEDQALAGPVPGAR